MTTRAGIGAEINVTVVYSPAPRQVQEHTLTLPAGSSVADALKAAVAQGMLANVSAGDLALLPVGVWGRRAALNAVLQDHDRLEVYRALKVDPKVARRERFVKQGAKKAGLFAQRRAGAKPGY
jgi:putative ubiquitin-RnfH superfamily antitoxin RatB of RatAB toxin-antitoxin module